MNTDYLHSVSDVVIIMLEYMMIYEDTADGKPFFGKIDTHTKL
jgi:hypothetical protein